MAIETLSQAVSVPGTVAVSFTDIDVDTTTNEYVREVRVSQTVNGSPTITFRLQLRAATREGIEFTTPSLTV